MSEQQDNRNTNTFINKNLYNISMLYLQNCSTNHRKPNTEVIYCIKCNSYVLGKRIGISLWYTCIFCKNECDHKTVLGIL